MESSNEDIFTDASAESPVKKDSVRFSTYTIYQSATDLEMHPMDSADAEERTLVDGSNSLERKRRNPNSPIGPICCSKMFEDGCRSIDYILAWEEGKGPVSAENKRKIFQQNLKVEKQLDLELETLDKLRFLKIHVPISVLKGYAEVLRIRMPMKEIPGQEELFQTQYTPLMTEVKTFLAKLCSCVRLDPLVFPPDKFRLSAEYSPHKSYLFDDSEEELFTSQTRTVIANYILERTSYSDDPSATSAVGIDRLLEEGVFKAAYPLHDGACDEVGSLRCLLLREWANVSKWAMYQPIDQVREYFGVKFGLYFAWLGFYTHMLVPASIAGVLVTLYGLATLPFDNLSRDICNDNLNITMCPQCDGTCDYWKLKDTCAYSRVTYLFDNPATLIFAVFMSFWAALFLELWKRYSASIAHRWGLTDFTAQSEPPRPQYLNRLASSQALSKRVKYKMNSFTGENEKVLPFWSFRLPAILVSFSLAILLVVVAIMAVLGVVLYRMSVLASVSLQDKDSVTTYTLVIIPITSAAINLIFIIILNWVYDMVAVWLTELEFQRTQTEFDESLTIKIYLFQFVNYYTSIMYIAFIKGKFVGTPAKYNRIFGLRQEECNPGGCLMELCIQLAIIMVGQQAINAVIENLVPLLYKLLSSFYIKAGLKASGSKEIIDPKHKPWTEDYKLISWSSRGLFYEYLEMVMQYGFVTLFVPAFPLAPLFALLNNIFEMRLDARKFLKYYKRPVPTRAPNIGVWFKILDILGRLAVISNAFIIAFSSNFIPRLVYMMTVSKEGTDEGFLEHSLAYFNTADFETPAFPRFPTVNTTVCRYAEYREPYFSATKYKRPAIYWHVLAARLAFIVIFQNVVSMVVMLVRWAIPDVPSKLKDQIRREGSLINDMIIEHERRRALLADSKKEDENEVGVSSNHVKKDVSDSITLDT